MPSPAGENIQAKPFLRWAGGKRKLAELIVSSFPTEFWNTSAKYFEPFLGGGAVTFQLGNSKSDFYVSGKNLYLNDINPDLIIAYKQIQNNPTQLMDEIDKIAMKKNQYEFDEIKNWEPDSNIERAARFIYLNKTCFNGLWRVNSQGKFNVPFGKLKNPIIYQVENLIAVSQRLAGAKITNLAFSQALEMVSEGDLVYLDPPYLPLNSSSSFAQYAKQGFGLLEHYSLAGVIEGLTKRGAFVILSNSDTPETREIYGQTLTLRQVSVARSISANAESRHSVREIVGVNYRMPKTSGLHSLKILN